MAKSRRNKTTYKKNSVITRSKKRIKEHGEVFTPPELVNKMLDKLPQDMWEENKTFIDNSCGNGNMLIEILKRKLKYKHNSRKALSTIYGVDIMKDNVVECKLRLLELVESLYIKTKEDAKRIISILNKNIVCADALTYDYSFDGSL